MTIEAITQSTTDIYTTGIELNSVNPANLAAYYETKIGLTLINKDEASKTYQLGTPDGIVLITIYPTDQEKTQRTAGLYHLALLLPTRADLGAMLRHMVEGQIGLEGASDHGYSEALYLTDPEGNGIEIYADKAESEWDKHDNGLIGGIVIAMDAESVLAAQTAPFNGVPNGTTMGHIHIHVGDIDKALSFYHEIMGLGLKFIMNEQALFMATRGYHHHLGANLWNGRNIPAPQDGTQGLRNSIWTASSADFATIETKLTESNYAFTKEGESLYFKDPAGTGIILTVEK